MPTEDEARGLLSYYLKTNLNSKRGSMTAAARLFAHSSKCSPALREAILREKGPARASKHQLPVMVKRAMMASQALVAYSRNPRNADVMFGHARRVLRRHWSEDRRLYAGECMSADDGTINFVVCVPWTHGGCKCSEKYGVKVGRFQLLAASDSASDYIPGFVYVVRQTSAYRAEDVCGFLGRLWRDTVKPDVAVLERGTWESDRVSAMMDAARVKVGRSYAPRQKLIENVFNRLWTVLSVMPGQVGRFRGEMERENKLLAAAQAGTLDPRDVFVSLPIALAALEQAVDFLNRTPVESKDYGKWIPEQRWREDLTAHPRARLDPSLAYLWAPEVKTWKVRRATVGGMVEMPLGMSLPAHWWAPELLECDGRYVTAYFDPWEPSAPATLTLTDAWPVRGWKAGRVLASGVPCLEDLPAISRDASNALAVVCGDGDPSGALERAKQMRSTLRSIVLREYRAAGAAGMPLRRESEVRAPSLPAPFRSAEEPDDPAEATPPARERSAATPRIINRSSRVLTDEEEAAELARIEARERAYAERNAIPLF